jgi:hypothetical protein
MQNMCANERELHLLDHIELASILATQLGSKSEAILLRERVLRDAVAKKDELIHRQSKKGKKGFLTAGVEYLFVSSSLVSMDERTQCAVDFPDFLLLQGPLYTYPRVTSGSA